LKTNIRADRPDFDAKNPDLNGNKGSTPEGRGWDFTVVPERDRE
jgi:hypothetical protein